MESIDHQIRIAAFEWLKKVTDVQGDVLSREILSNGFFFSDIKVPLVAPLGIFKPKHMQFPLTITSAPNKPYDDFFGEDGFLVYKYRGFDINHPDNVGLRKAGELSIPLIYLHGIVPGKYLATWPVYVVYDDPENLSFKIGLGDYDSIFINKKFPQDTHDRRIYSTTVIRARLHQRSFRERVLYAYRNQCSLCRLRHQELLDAAHIIPDKEELGDPIINNGIALCKLHHAAFDSFIIGINSDYKITVREDILNELDGPMLQYGLKNLDNCKIILPIDKKNWPDRELLNLRYQRFISY